MEALLQEMDEDQLRSFARTVEDDPGSQNLLFAIHRAIFLHTSTNYDLDRALEAAEQVLLATTPDEDRGTRAQIFEDASHLQTTKFKRTSATAKEDFAKTYLDRAISWAQEALNLTPQNENVQLRRRMEHLRDLLDKQEHYAEPSNGAGEDSIWNHLDKIILMDPDAHESQEDMISHARQALATIPLGDPGRLLQSSSLRNLLARKCRATNAKVDVDQAIVAAETATRVAEEMLAHLTKAWFSLGVLVARRCKLDDYVHVGDLDYAIRCFDNTIDGLKEREYRGECLETLSELLFHRYEHTSNVEDAKRCVATAERVLEFVAAGVAGRDLALVKLAVRLERLFHATRDVKLLDRAMLLVDEALGLLPKDSPEQIRYRAEYTSLLLRKYEISMDIKYLNQGIEDCDRLWDIAEKEEAEYTKYWAIVGQLLRHRYDRIELKQDIERAVYATKKALKSLTPSHPEYPAVLGNLATILASKFDCDRVKDDIDSAIDLAKESVKMTPDGNAWKPLQISRLSRLLAIRNDDGDIDQCVLFAEQAARASVPGRIDYLEIRGYFALSLYLRSRSSVSPAEDLGRAIEEMKTLVADTPADEVPITAHLLGALSSMLIWRFEITESPADLDDGADTLRMCLKNPSSRASTQIWEARRAADLLLFRSRLTEANLILRSTVKLLRKLSPRSLQQKDQQKMVKKFAGLAALATSVALETGAGAGEALVLLEEGRGFILGLLFEVRSDIADLRQKHPDLAAEFEQMRDSLDSTAAYGDLESMATQLSLDLTQRGKIAKDFDDVVDRIRRVEGFENFLLAPSVAELKSAASTGPVVVVNTSRLRSDAFIITPDRIDLLPLPELCLEDIRDRAVLLKSGNITEPQMFQLLGWLWDTLGRPILDRLEGVKSLETTSSEKPRVWWIPTGPLCSLPIHAAGNYTSGDMVSKTLMDRVMSSYGLSVKAMLFTKHNMLHWDRPGASETSLLVSMGTTPGCSSLPHAQVEVDAIRNVFMSNTSFVPDVLSQPNKSELLAALKGAAILHFAGHGALDPVDPLKSALLLSDWQVDPLTVKDLIALKLHQTIPLLAYLSACSTGSTMIDDLLDEGLHLMSACQLVGFQHVVGSLWEVSDEHCVGVARKVAEALAVDSVMMNDGTISMGLQEGIRSLRGQLEARDGGSRAGRLVAPRRWVGGDPRIWAAYIHMGP
ncbi:uncharacterized protein TRUGW13939_06654 [Talaromyces rugulosus]|uniref:CHAT domain-containing protein n=1 Tax=Talaromyces rugulosus TaxID=121627 RepID=A0A7H8QZJ3_TALRU|nr:uncharacterized protein TRUGW13939_06654 [Talaromyces rugulosus]QKX59520.1 hypothetical protein TRUGW13939_06654 [Talaromyces rugulosus]